MHLNEMASVLSGLKLMLPKWAPAEISQNLCLMWLDTLKDYSDDEIKQAFRDAAQSLTEWPTPVAIKRLCQGTHQTDEEIGAEVSGRIAGAITRFGYTQPELAEKDLGPIAWEVVRIFGGWPAICDLNYSEMASAKKQWRDLATEVSKKFHKFGIASAPALPKAKENKGLLANALAVAQGRA